jgi:DNA-binding NarL/FixJ family response regulator
VPKEAIRILLVEDNEIVRLAQELTIKNIPDLVLCDYAADGLTAVAKAQELRPEVILMDIGLSGIDGIEAAALIKAAEPGCRILFFTSQTSEQTIFEALAVGADAFSHKDISGEKLGAVIHHVFNGIVWLDPRVAATVSRHCFVDSAANEEKGNSFSFGGGAKFAITVRENEALYYLSCEAAIEKGQHLLHDEMLAHSQILRKLFSRIVKRSKSACDC